MNMDKKSSAQNVSDSNEGSLEKIAKSIVDSAPSTSRRLEAHRFLYECAKNNPELTRRYRRMDTFAAILTVVFISGICSLSYLDKNNNGVQSSIYDQCPNDTVIHHDTTNTIQWPTRYIRIVK